MLKKLYFSVNKWITFGPSVEPACGCVMKETALFSQTQTVAVDTLKVTKIHAGVM